MKRRGARRTSQRKPGSETDPFLVCLLGIRDRLDEINMERKMIERMLKAVFEPHRSGRQPSRRPKA